MLLKPPKGFVGDELHPGRVSAACIFLCVLIDCLVSLLHTDDTTKVIPHLVCSESNFTVCVQISPVKPFWQNQVSCSH